MRDSITLKVHRFPISKLHENLTSFFVYIGGYKFNLVFEPNTEHIGWHSLYLNLLASRDKRVSLPRDVKTDFWLVLNHFDPSKSSSYSVLHTFSEPGGYGFADFIETAHLQDEDEDESCLRNNHITIKANITLK